VFALHVEVFALHVEVFALHVQADNRALMERLIWFARAHGMFKKNAQIMQKLAQDSNAALEAYQRQVRTLEEQLAVCDKEHTFLSGSQSCYADNIQDFSHRIYVLIHGPNTQ
jgi:CII-binding regulator of phage lambda lysogenization HflD